MKGKKFIPVPSFSRTVHGAGTTITYIRRGSYSKEMLIVPGPTKEDIKIVVG